MSDLDFNAGRLGMSPEKLMEIGYQKIEASARLYGYTVSKLSAGKVSVSGSNGIIVATYSAEDVLRGRAF